MRKSLLKLLWAAAGLALSASVHAVGLGGINVTSALGQPLKAEIDLMAVSKSEKGSLAARLASTDSYKTAGLDYPYGNKFKFEIQTRADGESYIKVSSAQPINDPFVSLLVELSWAAGKLSREYTFLLDPVDYVPVQPAPVAVKPVAPALQAAEPVQAPEPTRTFAVSAVPAVQVSSAVTPAVPVVEAAQSAVPEVSTAASAVPEVAVEGTEKSGEQATQVAPAPMEQPPAPVTAAAEKQEAIEVHRGDTLYKIAARYKLADMNLERMLVALYRVNAKQFDGRNMNRIRAGKILQLPSQDDYDKVTLSEAVKEIHAQAVDWNAYRQKLASAATTAIQPEAAEQVASGKISSSVLDNAPVAKESAKEVLKLSRGEAPGDKTATGAGGKVMSEQDRKNAAQEDAIAKAKAEQEGQMRTAMLEKNIQDMKRLAQLKTEAAALAHPRNSAVAAAPVQPAPARPAPANAAKPKPKVQTEPSLVDQILNEPLYLAGGAAGLLVIGLLGFMLKRRKKKRDNDETLEETADDLGSTTGRITQPVVPSPDTGDFTRAFATQPAAEAVQSENVDPISEADLFLNFGRDVQAEEILKEALQNTPNNHQIHLKLLGIYASRKDAGSFSVLARQLLDTGDQAAWQQAAEMGRKLDPANPIYGGSSGGFRSMEDTGSATVQIPAFNVAAPEPAASAQPSGLDFDFDAAAPQANAAAEQDFLGDQEKTMVLSTDQTMGMDFDITSTNPAMQAVDETATLSDAGSLIFDVTGSHSSTPAEQPKTTPPADDGGLAFTLDFPVEEEAEKPAPVAPAAAMAFSGISLNFDDAGAAPVESAPAGGNDQWQEVSTKLDLAKAYQEMGDNEGAREILEEVMREGDAKQREAAQAIFDQLV